MQKKIWSGGVEVIAPEGVDAKIAAHHATQIRTFLEEMTNSFVEADSFKHEFVRMVNKNLAKKLVPMLQEAGWQAYSHGALSSDMTRVTVLRKLTRKVIFFDIDGVLNTFEQMEKVPGGSPQHAWLCGDKVRLLETLALATKAELVLCSVWAFSPGIEKTIQAMEFHGFSVGVPFALLGNFAKATEIKQWLDANGQDTKWVSFDDDRIFDAECSNFIRVDPRVGLTESDCERARILLT
jgi:hypothetical protein